MRNIHLIEQFMKENDIEYDVPFTVDFRLKNRIESENFKICLSRDCGKSTVVLKKIISHEDVECSKDTLLAIIFNDIVNVRKKPWMPENHENFWYVCLDGTFNTAIFTDSSVIHLAMYISGNCFKSLEEAKKHKDDVLRVINGEPLVKWED